MSAEHPNSKIITIFRTGSFLSRAQGKDVDDFYSMSKKSIGSCWESVSSKRVGSGLTFNEEAILMPMVIDVPLEDREFRKKVTQFFIDIDTQIPYNNGRQFEIGLELSNDKPLFFDSKEPTKCNMPLNVTDYIRYRHALKHPQVASSKESADGNMLIEFYVFDPTEVQKKNTKKADERDAAMQIYLTIKPDVNKVNQMLTLLGVDPREFGDNEDERTDALRQKAEKEASRFIEVHSTTNLESLYWIQTMVNTGVIKKLGDKYYDVETNKLISNSEQEFTMFLLDEDNSDTVISLKARVQESMKKPVPKRRKQS